jgi:hypothetical protein
VHNLGKIKFNEYLMRKENGEKQVGIRDKNRSGKNMT